VRFFILRAHYRSPLNYSDAHLEDAKQALTRLYTALKNVPPAEMAVAWGTPEAARFKEAMDDDFNTADAVAVLFDLANEVNRTGDPVVAGLLKALAGTLGLLQREARDYLQGRDVVVTPGFGLLGLTGYAPEVRVGLGAQAIDERIAQRAAAKKAKNYAEADRIRAELLEAGIVLEDKPGGVTEWRRA